MIFRAIKHFVFIKLNGQPKSGLAHLPAQKWASPNFIRSPLRQREYKRPKLAGFVTARRSEPRPTINCHRCGTRHRKMRRECPAYGSICQKCGKRNHRTSCCDAIPPKRDGPREDSYSSDDDRMYRVERKSSVASTNKNSQKRRTSKIYKEPKNTETFVVIEGRQVDVIIDTGTDITLVNKRIATELGLASRVKSSEMKLNTYTGQDLELVGTATVTMEKAERV